MAELAARYGVHPNLMAPVRWGSRPAVSRNLSRRMVFLCGTGLGDGRFGGMLAP